jgi:hypothetical protein
MSHFPVPLVINIESLKQLFPSLKETSDRIYEERFTKPTGAREEVGSSSLYEIKDILGFVYIYHILAFSE